MKKGNSGDFMVITGKILAVGAALLSIIKVIPANSIILWICVIIGAALIFSGNKYNNDKK